MGRRPQRTSTQMGDRLVASSRPRRTSTAKGDSLVPDGPQTAAHPAGAVARSPIAAAEPAGVADGWLVSRRRSTAGLRLQDCTALAKVLLHAADPAGAAAALGVPAGRAARNAAGTMIAGSGPGEWTLIGRPGAARPLSEWAAGLRITGLVTVVDLTHAWALLRLTGAAAPDALAKVCPVDLDDRVTPDGSAFRAPVAKLAAGVIRDDTDGTRSYLLHCERSFGQYLFDALLDAASEFGAAVDGLTIPGEPGRP